MTNVFPLPAGRQVRDLTIVDLNDKQCLVVACDSAGAIGPKELDELKISNYILGRFISRVALMEVMAAGALPVVIVDTLSVEMEPGGKEIIKGIKEELKQIDLEDKVLLTGSTEENFPTRQSGIGITVIGIADKEKLRLGSVSSGDAVICIGLPKVGSEVTLTDPEIVTPKTVMELISFREIHELVPVGSKGILYEARTLAHLAGKKLRLFPDCNLPLEKSAGPATCLVAAVAPEFQEQLTNILSLPVSPVGTIE